MNDDKAMEAAWDALKDRCCADPANAKQCVMVRREPFEAAVRAYLAQREADGAVMVPVEPTDGMLAAVALQFFQQGDELYGSICTQLANEYRTMIAARPNP